MPPPAILIAATTWDSCSARLAQAFALAGSHVTMMSPRGHAARTLRSVQRHLPYRALSALADLRTAIATTQPAQIIPCDSRAVDHLHLLHAEERAAGDPRHIAASIERSLGDPAGFAAVRSHSDLLALAASLSICAPETRRLHNSEDLHAWRDARAFPWLLRRDGPFVQTRTYIAHSWPQALAAFASLQRPLSATAALRHLGRRELFSLLERARAKPEITVQSHLSGRSATAMFACHQGEILGELAVDVLATQHLHGAPTMVRTLEAPAITRSARLLVSHLKLSGFCALDFILEPSSGEPYLTRFHPHSTQLGHLRPHNRPSLASALLGASQTVPPAMPGHSPTSGYPPTSGGKIIAFFPHAWHATPREPLLAFASVQHDIPWGEPELIRQLFTPPRHHLRGPEQPLALACSLRSGSLSKIGKLSTPCE